MRRAASTTPARAAKGVSGMQAGSSATDTAPPESPLLPGALRASTTRTPASRAASAAVAPAMPPPTTSTSHSMRGAGTG